MSKPKKADFRGEIFSDSAMNNGLGFLYNSGSGYEIWNFGADGWTIELKSKIEKTQVREQAPLRVGINRATRRFVLIG